MWTDIVGDDLDGRAILYTPVKRELINILRRSSMAFGGCRYLQLVLTARLEEWYRRQLR